MKNILLLTALMVTAVHGEPASAALYVGGVSNPQAGGDGLMVTGGNWLTAGATLDWEVDDLGGGLWHYKYTFNTNSSPETSHFILELSLGVTERDILNLDVTDQFGDVEVSFFDPGPGNPGLLGQIFGIKIDETVGNPLIIEFDIRRAPVWGDFYAKGGSTSFAYNAGFLAADPANPPANGSLLDHILRPDTTNGIVPEASSIAAWSICAAFGALVAYRRRRS